MFAHNLYPMHDIDKPTIICPTSATLIDNILVYK